MLSFGNVRSMSKKVTRSLTGRTDGNSIAVVRQAIANPAVAGFGPLTAALDEIVRQKLWKNVRTAAGAPFESFTDFALGAAPHGLGVNSQAAARLLRHGLLENKHFREWTAILKSIAKKQGRPKKIVNPDGLRFYTVDGAMTGRDRLLLALERDSLGCCRFHGHLV